VFVGGSIGKGDSHRDAEFAFGSALEDAAGWRDFGIIASNGNANVAFASEDVVGGIEFSPSESRQQGLDPGVGRTFGGGSLDGVGMEKISADIATRNAKFAGQRDHDVGEVLANAFARSQRVVNG